MKYRSHLRINRSRPIFVTALVFFLCANVQTAEISPEDTSLDFVPSDAAVYSSSVQLDVQLTQLLNSNAYARVQSHPMVQFGLAQIQGFWRAQSETYEQLMEDPSNQQLLAVLKDSVSHEIFMYGDTKLATWLSALAQFSNQMNTIRMEAAIQSGGDADGDELAKKLVIAFLESVDLSHSPGGVLGFKTTMAAGATSQIARLRQFAEAMIENTDDLAILKNRLATKSIHGSPFLTLTLDGTMIPWDEMGDNVPVEIRQKLQTELSKATFTISLGVLENYVLLAVGPDTSAIESLGQGESLLARKELEPIRKAGAKQFVSFSYIAENLMHQLGSPRRMIEQYASLGKTALQGVDEIDDEIKSSLIDDIDALKDDILSFERKLGAVTSYSFMNDSGYEGYSYDWKQRAAPVPSKPLTIVDHVGGSPIMFIASRAYSNPRAEEIARKWLSRGFYYTDRLVRQQMEKQGDEDSLDKYKAVVAELMPLVNELSIVLEKKLNPAFANEQSAFVMDAEARDDQWHQALPPGEDLPMLEIASLSTVSNAPLAREGFGDVFRIAQTALDRIVELDDGDKIPFDTIPLPNEEPFADGTIYSYDLPPAAQLNPKVSPNALITSDVMVLSLMPETTRRLSQKTALDIQGVFVDSDKPFSMVAYFSPSKFIGRIREWIDFGAELTGNDISVYEVFFDVAQCFESFSMASYAEGEATVTHFESRFRDLD